MLGAKDGAPPRRRAGAVLPVATATANPRSVDRVFRELRRSQQPDDPEHLRVRKTGHSSTRTAEEEGAEAADVTGTGLEALEADARQGRIGRGSPMTVEICYCLDSAQRSLAVKLQPERYRQAALVSACRALWA